MIHTIRTVAVGDQESKIDSPIILYRGDREVEVEFTINGSKFTFTNGGNVIKSTNATHGQLVINTPTGENMFSEVTECHDGKVVFVITKEMIDELIEVGFYSFQIRLFDESQVSRVTIPPVLKGIDIRNPIAAEDETNVVDIGLVDYAVVVKDEFEDLSTFLPDGNYNKTEWESKDVISEAKLNKIEDALYNINSNMEATDLALLNRVENINKNVYGKIEKLGDELESEVEEFERNLNFNVEQFKIDTNIAMTAHSEYITQENKKMMTIIDDTENIQSVIDDAIDKVKFVKGDYNITKNIKLKGGIEYDGCGSTLYLKNACIEIENNVKNIVFKNFNIMGDLKYTKITGLYNDGTQIKCEEDVFEIGDILGCSNYGVTDKPYVTITSFHDGVYELNTSISTTGILLNDDWGAVVGNFQWSALINGKHNTNDITIENCTFENARGYAIALPNSDNITIKNTVIKNNGLDFCVFSAENKDRFNLLIENCTFEQSIDFGKQGIVIPKVPNIYYKNIKILNSTFRKISENAISFGYARGNIQNLIIKGCEFTDNVLFAIHCCGNYLTIKDNIIQGSQVGIRIADISSVTYEDDSMYSDIYISNNNISRCKNGIVLTQVKKSSGGNFNPKNIEILNNVVSVNYSAVEVCGQNINVVGNRIYSDENNGYSYYASSLFIHGDNNRCVNVTGNFFDGEINVIWTNTFDLKISNNTFNSLMWDKNIRVRSMDSPNKQINMKCVIENNTFYKANSILLSTNDGKDYTLFKNNKIINGDLIVNIPYMVAKPARYECDGDGLHWISNVDNNWMITKDNYFECGGKYGYIASDGTLKVTDDILNIN